MLSKPTAHWALLINQKGTLNDVIAITFGALILNSVYGVTSAINFCDYQ